MTRTEWLILLALVILFVTLAYFLTGCTLPPAKTRPAPPAPTLTARPLRVLKAKWLSPHVTLAWDASPSPEVIGYRIYQGVQTGAYTTIWTTDTNLTYTITNLTAGVTYYFTATAFSTNLESVFSNEVTYTPPAGAAFFTLSTLAASSPDGPWLPFTNLPPVSFTNPPGAASFFKLAITWTNLP